jgi:hypothetical protein
MLRELHHFSVCVQDLKWLLEEGDKIIQQQIKKTELVAPESTYTQEMAVLGQEFRSLVLRFGCIDRGNFKHMEQWLQSEREEKMRSHHPSAFEVSRPDARQTLLADTLDLPRF